MKRDEFIRTLGRILILGAFAALIARVMTRKHPETSCSVSPACKSCSKFSECELPQAVKK